MQILDDLVENIVRKLYDIPNPRTEAHFHMLADGCPSESEEHSDSEGERVAAPDAGRLRDE